MKIKFKSFAQNAVIVVVTTFIALFILEVIARKIAPHDPDYYNVEKFTTQTGKFPSLIPNSYSSNYIGIPIKINSRGLRGGDVVVPKPAGLFRVLIIGDSIAFGTGVKLEDTHGKKLEVRLRSLAFRKPFVDVEVVNAGVGATGLDYYQYALQRRVPELQPNVVIIDIALNDIYNYEEQTSAPAHHALLRRISYAILSRSQFYSVAYMRLHSLLYRFGILDIMTMHDNTLMAFTPASERRERAWRSTLSILGQLIERAKQLKVPFVLAIFPTEFELDQNRLELYKRNLGFRLNSDALNGEPNQRLASFARKHGAYVLDLLPIFRAEGQKQLFQRNTVISYDWNHPTPEGHQVVADALFRMLKGRDLLPIAR